MFEVWVTCDYTKTAWLPLKPLPTVITIIAIIIIKVVIDLAIISAPRATHIIIAYNIIFIYVSLYNGQNVNESNNSNLNT